MKGMLTGNRKNDSLFAVIFALFLMCLFLSFPSIYLRHIRRDQSFGHLGNITMSTKSKVWIKERPVHFIPWNDLTEYDSLIEETAQKYRVDFALVKAVIKAESNFNNKAVSKKGAKGLMQLMPRTASILGVNDCFHPKDNIVGGIRHLGYLIDLFKGDIPLALAAYNAGEGVVAKYRGIPPYSETRLYIRRVLKNYKRYRHEPVAVTGTG